MRRLGENCAIVAIAHILIETIYKKLTNDKEFVDKIEQLTGRKIIAMTSKAIRQSEIITEKYRINDLDEDHKERRKSTGNEGKLNKADEVI